MELSLSTKPIARDTIEEELIADEMFLYNPAHDGTAHRLNSGAAIVWMLCDGSRDISQIAREIATTYDLAEHKVLQDVKSAVEHFYALGLLVS